MKFKIKNNFSQNINNITRDCGYLYIVDRKTNKDSYIRKLTNDHYPRFHLYLKEVGDEIIFDLHLDQTSSRYNNQTAHNADYDSPEVKNELIRIYQVLKKFIQ